MPQRMTRIDRQTQLRERLRSLTIPKQRLCQMQMRNPNLAFHPERLQPFQRQPQRLESRRNLSGPHQQRPVPQRQMRVHTEGLCQTSSPSDVPTRQRKRFIHRGERCKVQAGEELGLLIALRSSQRDGLEQMLHRIVVQTTDSGKHTRNPLERRGRQRW